MCLTWDSRQVVEVSNIVNLGKWELSTIFLNQVLCSLLLPILVFVYVVIVAVTLQLPHSDSGYVSILVSTTANSVNQIKVNFCENRKTITKLWKLQSNLHHPQWV